MDGKSEMIHERIQVKKVRVSMKAREDATGNLYACMYAREIRKELEHKAVESYTRRSILSVSSSRPKAGHAGMRSSC